MRKEELAQRISHSAGEWSQHLGEASNWLYGSAELPVHCLLTEESPVSSIVLIVNKISNLFDFIVIIFFTKDGAFGCSAVLHLRFSQQICIAVSYQNISVLP